MCRTANGHDINFMELFKRNINKVINNDTDKLENYYSAANKDGRGNICPITIIMPTLAMEVLTKKFKGVTSDYCEMVQLAHKDDETKEEVFSLFMKYLDKKMGEAKDTCIERFNWICSQPVAAARFMWDNNVMGGYVPEQGTVSAFKHGTLAIGQIALAETLQILIGENQVTDTGMSYAKRIEQLFKDNCTKWKEEYKLNFGVYYTPAENLCHTALKRFRKKYGIIPKVSDRDYFTNSIHVPVWEDIDAFKKIDIESQLTGYSSAGCITYVELPSTAINNIDALETIVNYAMDKDIPYFALNMPLDYCRDCHAQGDFNGVCSECGSRNIDELRRVTGYLSTTKKHFNKGKQEETDNRVKHIKH